MIFKHGYVFIDGKLTTIEQALPTLLERVCKDDNAKKIVDEYLSQYGARIVCGELNTPNIYNALLSIFDSLNALDAYINQKEGEMVVKISELKKKYVTGQLDSQSVIRVLEELSRSLSTMKWIIRNLLMSRLGMPYEIFFASILEQIQKGGHKEES